MSLLPPNSTLLEIALDEAMDEQAIFAPALIEIKGIKYARPLNPTFAAWLVQEYGLGMISQFFGEGAGVIALSSDGDNILTTDDGDIGLYVSNDNTIEDLIDQGRIWQRIRGTPAAVVMALAWISYFEPVVLDQVLGRRRWHLYQIDMKELPGTEEAYRLASAEYLAGISDSTRSYFWRGFHGYDVRGHVWGRSRYGASIWGDSSGIRINGGKTKWSHGRQHQLDMIALMSDQVALGLTFEDGDELTWSDDVTWDSPGLAWDGVESAVELNAWLISKMPAYLSLYDVDDELIAYLKILVAPIIEIQGDQLIAKYKTSTDFGDGFGSSVARIDLSFGGENVSDVKPFKKWLLPDQVEFDPEVAIGPNTVAIDLSATIREFFSVELRIEA